MKRTGTPGPCSGALWKPYEECHSLLLYVVQWGPLVDLSGGRCLLNSLDHLSMKYSGGSWWPPSRDAGQGVPTLGAKLHSVLSTCLLARRASSHLAPLLKAEQLPSERESFCGWNPVRRIFSLTSHLWSHILLSDFCREPHRVPRQLLLLLKVKESGVRKTRLDQKTNTNQTNKNSFPANRVVSWLGSLKSVESQRGKGALPVPYFILPLGSSCLVTMTLSYSSHKTISQSDFELLVISLSLVRDLVVFILINSGPRKVAGP